MGKRTPKSIDNIDGATVGGPIRRNKLFFFGDWEGRREGQNFSQTYTVATAGQRTGDFSSYNTTILSGGASPNQYNSYAAFLLGMPQSVSKALQYYSPQTAREWQFAWYAQDRWAATHKLTVSLGLRWEFYPDLYRANEGLEILRRSA